jgi:hypothetical protein
MIIDKRTVPSSNKFRLINQLLVIKYASFVRIVKMKIKRNYVWLEQEP